jgi:hypothetical protein
LEGLRLRPRSIANARSAQAATARWLLIHLDVDVLSFTDFPIAEEGKSNRAFPGYIRSNSLWRSQAGASCGRAFA